MTSFIKVKYANQVLKPKRSGVTFQMKVRSQLLPVSIHQSIERAPFIEMARIDHARYERDLKAALGEEYKSKRFADIA